MRKLRTVIQYECMTSFKYIWVFYGILYMIVAITLLLGFMATGSLDRPYMNMLEFNSMVYMAILGVLGFKEDFKMLMQNGFTRKYIFLATLSLFAFISACMALVDTITGIFISSISVGYSTFVGSLYGAEHSLFVNWLLLFLAYMCICCIAYTCILLQSKLGKKWFIYVAIVTGLSVFLLLPALFQYVIPVTYLHRFVQFLIQIAGFMQTGMQQIINPAITLMISVIVFGCFAYLLIRKIELKV